MKKLIISAMLFAMGCLSVAAQDNIFNNPDNKPYFGVRVAGDITCPGNVTAENVGVSVFKNGGGIEFGGIFNLPLVANLYIEPGLKLYYDTYSMKKEWVESIQDDIVMNSLSVRKFGMRIPVMVGYRFDFTKDMALSVFTGPEFEIGFSAKEYVKGHNIETSGSLYGDEGGMKRVNVLWGIGAGITFRHIYFGINGAIGMVNMMSDSEANYHENRVSIALGYNF